jgi:hypothetical protein
MGTLSYTGHPWPDLGSVVPKLGALGWHPSRPVWRGCGSRKEKDEPSHHLLVPMLWCNLITLLIAQWNSNDVVMLLLIQLWILLHVWFLVVVTFMQEKPIFLLWFIIFCFIMLWIHPTQQNMIYCSKNYSMYSVPEDICCSNRSIKPIAWTRAEIFILLLKDF